MVGPADAVEGAIGERPRRVCYHDNNPCAWLTLVDGDVQAFNTNGPLGQEFGRQGVGWCPSSGWFGANATGSRWDQRGQVARGPAPRGLDRFTVTTDDEGNLVVHFASLAAGLQAWQVDGDVQEPAGLTADEVPFDRNPAAPVWRVGSGSMGVVIVSSVVLAVMLLWGLYSSPRRRGAPTRRCASGRACPYPADIAVADFPIAALGYDRRAVDAHLRSVADAFGALRTAMTMAAHDETVPVNDLLPIHDDLLPVHEDVLPAHGDALPVHDDVLPVPQPPSADALIAQAGPDEDVTTPVPDE